MTQWISSILHFSRSPHTVATVKSDGLLLHVQKVPRKRRTPPYLLTLELRASSGHELVRVVEVYGDTPQVCAALVAQLLAVAKQGLTNGHHRVPHDG
jgi:hypothetical protein